MDLIIVALVAVATIGLIYLTRRQLYGPSVRRAFAKLPPTTVGEIVLPGPVRLSGRAIAIGEPPHSEASGRPYVARDLRIRETGTGDSGSIRPAKQAVDFLLDDGTGKVLVRPADAAIAIPRDFAAPETTLDQVPWVDALLRAGGYYNGSPTTCKIEVYEGVLEPGAPAGVVGHAEPPDAEARKLGAKWVLRTEDKTSVAIRSEAPAEVASA